MYKQDDVKKVYPSKSTCDIGHDSARDVRVIFWARITQLNLLQAMIHKKIMQLSESNSVSN